MTGQKVLIAGDCWLPPGGTAVDLVSLYGACTPSLFILNLECSIPTSPGRKDKRALLALDARRLSELTLGANTVCVVANNHVTDFGPTGLLETLQEIRRAGLHPLGAGATLKEAQQPVFAILNGRRIGLLARADTRSHVGAVAATEDSPGVAPLIPDLVCDDLRDLSRRVDDLWLFLHWGREYLRYPEPEQRDLAMRFSEAGASLIVGTHPHVLRGAERLRSTPVYYSLGNFVFPPVPLSDGALKRWDRENNKSISLSGTFNDGNWHWRELPHIVSASGKPERAQSYNWDGILREFTSLSHPLHEGYATRYSSIRKTELVLHILRRLGTMGWRDRLRLPGHLIRTAYLRVRVR